MKFTGAMALSVLAAGSAQAYSSLSTYYYVVNRNIYSDSSCTKLANDIDRAFTNVSFDACVLDKKFYSGNYVVWDCDYPNFENWAVGFNCGSDQNCGTCSETEKVSLQLNSCVRFNYNQNYYMKNTCHKYSKSTKQPIDDTTNIKKDTASTTGGNGAGSVVLSSGALLGAVASALYWVM